MKKKLVNVIYPSPKILTVRNFISDSICNSLICSFGKEVLTSKVTDGKNIETSNQRKSSTLFLKNDLEEVIYIKKKLHDLFKLLPEKSETIQFTKYGVGDSYKPHFDAFENEKNQRQRLYTFILYLNNDFSGGETYFNKLNLEVKPETGMLLCFSNCISETKYLNPFMEHESRTIKVGTKYILSTWATESIKLP